MAEEIRCNTSTLATENGDVDTAIKNIETSRDNLKSILDRLDAMWDGDASEQFKIRFKRQLGELDAYCEALKGVSGYEKKAVNEYNQCIRDVDGIISSISV
ncbi:MAG: WXG100 family type VII secretion target [Eubacteriales bacterium]|nr:WXG100 family type VII secretion target [Eubacteriales bacterium]